MTAIIRPQHPLPAPTSRVPLPELPDSGAEPAKSTRRAASRLVGIDAARGVALLGMMAVHSLYEEDMPGHPTLAFSLFGGRAAAAFAVLAGVGLAFMTGRRRVRMPDFPATSLLVLGRALAIGLIGLLLGYTDASLGACILPYYALLFVLAIPLLLLPTWAIGLSGLVIAVGVPVLQHIWLPHLPPATLENPTFGYVFQHPVNLLIELSLNGEYPALPWLAYICAGLVVGRLSLGRLRVAIALAVTGIVLAVGAAVTSSVLLNNYGGLGQIWAAQPGGILTVPETTEVLNLGADGTVPSDTWWWLAIDAPHTSTPPDLIGTSGSAIALIGVLLLLGQFTQPVVDRIVRLSLAPLAAAGGMTLTLYTLHLAFINSPYDEYSAATGYTVQVIAALLIGLAWRKTAGRGPLESLVAAIARRAKNLARQRRPDMLPPPSTADDTVRIPLTALGGPR